MSTLDAKMFVSTIRVMKKPPKSILVISDTTALSFKAPDPSNPMHQAETPSVLIHFHQYEQPQTICAFAQSTRCKSTSSRPRRSSCNLEGICKDLLIPMRL